MSNQSQSESRIADGMRFLGSNHRAVLITQRISGGLQSSPVAAVADSEGHVLVSTRSGSAKERNVTQDSRVSLCVLSDSWYGPWVHVDASAEIVRLPQAMEHLVDYYRRISGDHPDWDEYRQAMEAERRVILRLTPNYASRVAPRPGSA